MIFQLGSYSFSRSVGYFQVGSLNNEIEDLGVSFDGSNTVEAGIFCAFLQTGK